MGIGAVQCLELAYKTTTIGLYRYMEYSNDWMLKLVFEHEKHKKLHSVVNEGRKFAIELDIDLDSDLEEDLKVTESARNIKKIAKNNGTGKISNSWKK